MSIRVYDNAPLRRLNTFGIDATARRLVEYTAAEDLAVLAPQLRGERVLNVGRGSNLLFVNPVFDGVVLHSLIGGIAIDGRRVSVGAGVEWDAVVAATIEAGLGGLENLSLIPGDAGSAAVQNIGAYGAEAGDFITCVHTVDLHTAEPVDFDREAMDYGYRRSLLKRPDMRRYAVTSVDLELPSPWRPQTGYRGLAERLEGAGITPRAIRDAVIALRREKLPDPAVLGNAGSFFMNPVVDRAKADEIRAEYPAMPAYDAPDGRVKLPAGWLIEQAGWKGRSLGPAGVYERQALILVNRGGATGADIVALARAVIADVDARFGVVLRPEVNFID